MLKLIVATDEDGGIGLDDTIPWMGKFPEDMKWFKQVTLGHTVIMGRKTHEGVGNLNNRKTICISSQGNYKEIDILEVAHTHVHMTAFLAGGESIYKQALEMDVVDAAIITRIPGRYHCNKHFFLPAQDFKKDFEFLLGDKGVRVEWWVRK